MRRLLLILGCVLALVIIAPTSEAKNYLVLGPDKPMASLEIRDEGIKLCLSGVKEPSCSDVSREYLLDTLLFPEVGPIAEGPRFVIRDGIVVADEAAQASAISIRVTVDGVNTDQTFTARQIALLNRRLADFNAQRTANGQATVTMGVFLRGFIVQALKAEQDQAEAHEQAEACAAFAALSANAQNQIKAALGDKSPCR